MEEAPDEPEVVPATMESTVNEEVVENGDEEECRVCRGPAEDGRPLFSPCKCSGSMGKTHQDCLTSWLEVTRGSGRCEICKIKFRFDPQYAENAPDRLPAYEVLLGLSSRFIAKWLPLACRILLATSLWLIAAPLLTNVLYHGWMIRPSSVLTRWKWELLFPDVVSGAVTVAMIIISFLSLMSFADFLRVHWQQQQQRPRDQQARHRRDGEGQAGAANGIGQGNDEETSFSVPEETVDRRVLQFVENLRNEEKIKKENTKEREKLSNSATEDRSRLFRTHLNIRNTSFDVPADSRGSIDGLLGEVDGPNNVQDVESMNAEEVPIYDEKAVMDDLSDDQSDEIADEGELQDHNDRVFDEENEDLEAEVVNENDAPDFNVMEPGLQDDQADMEINVALDEMLGLRGPFGVLIRNLLWLLAFNATYLGIFGFVPKTIGSLVYTGIFNTTVCSNFVKSVPFVFSENQNRTTISSVLSRLEKESVERNTTFRLSDLSVVILGYLSIALCIVMARYALVLFQKAGQQLGGNSLRRTAHQEALRLHLGNAGHAANEPLEFDVADGETVASSMAGGLDAILSIVKVGVLLFLKMFLLPLFLGFCLDASTVHLFGHNLDQRLSFAGSDLFSFILLHWVGGITFMLLVTVFLLQLREVTHPDVLARVIRPQEPQPDLLGNLLNETVATHMKRMFLSLVIYAPLLSLQISFPIKLFLGSGFGDVSHFFRLNFYHVLMPQLQIPLELITFHLSMLALLERYKNSIGGMQHKWLKFICNRVGLTQYLLPRKVACFESVGIKSVLLSLVDGSAADIDPFFLDLTKASEDVAMVRIEESIANEAMRLNDLHRETLEGETNRNGERVLVATTSHIALPLPGDVSCPDRASSAVIYLPTKIGQFRLRLQVGDVGSNGLAVEFFREVPGEVVLRPPEGWDDLGVGGAWAQGRWAWSNERKSVIEEGVACRTPFRTVHHERWSVGLLLRIATLLVVSWVAVTVTVVALLTAPLAVGRCFHYLLRIPRYYVHDPFAFCIGAVLFFPTSTMLIQSTKDGNERCLSRIRKWLFRLNLPPFRKLCILAEACLLWFVISPTMLGVAYEVLFIKPAKWFEGPNSPICWNDAFLLWISGSAILNTWSFLLYFECFTKQFWANVGNGILEPPDDARHADDRDNFRNWDGKSWQGRHGRVAQFYGIWLRVFQNWEWDTIDKTLLLEDFARPVARELASALIGSSLSFQILLYLVSMAFPVWGKEITFPLFGSIGQFGFRLSAYRFCVVAHVLFQLASSFRCSIDGWFEAAHEAARDDRYLVGEMLLNYGEGGIS